MRTLPLALLLAACATVRAAAPLLTVDVAATAATDPVASDDAAADDPAIWRNPANLARSLVIRTDKKAGIHVYDLAGRRVSFTPATRLNDVDLREIDGRMIVAASDRVDVAQAHVALFTLDTAAGRLEPLGQYKAGAGEAHSMCL